ncbi:LysM peptidoglycan-binding domain-containing protein, partial [Streptomyces doebereineriae]
DVEDGEEGGLRAQGGGKQAATGEEYVVEAGDSLSKIATDELGDESKYPEIFELNKGEAQPDGSHFTNPDRIFPGQNLTLPATATAPNGTEPGPGDQQGPTAPAPQTPNGAGQSDNAQQDEAEQHNDNKGQGGVEQEESAPASPSAPPSEPSITPGPPPG